MGCRCWPSTSQSQHPLPRNSRPEVRPALATAASRAAEAAELSGFSEAEGLAEHVAPPPDGLDVVGPARCRRQLLAQLAQEHVDDLQLGLIPAAIQMAQEHVFRNRRRLPERQ